MMRPLIIMMRGIPSSGKTTAAKAIRNVFIQGVAVIVAKDDIRQMLYGPRPYESYSFDDLVKIEAHRDSIILQEATWNKVVIVDECFIEYDDMDRVFELPFMPNPDFILVDLSDTPFETSLYIDMLRENPRGYDVLKGFRDRLDKAPSIGYTKYRWSGDYAMAAFVNTIAKEKQREIQTRRDRNEGVSVS